MLSALDAPGLTLIESGNVRMGLGLDVISNDEIQSIMGRHVRLTYDSLNMTLETGKAISDGEASRDDN